MTKLLNVHTLATNLAPVTSGPARSKVIFREDLDTAMNAIWTRGRFTPWDPSFRTDVSPTSAVGTADVAANSTTMTVSATAAGAFVAGQSLSHAALPVGCYVLSLGTYASGTGTLTLSAAPTVAIVAGTINAIGGKTSAMADRSAVASNAVQATGANQPSMLKNALGNYNGEDRDGLLFDGTTTQNVQSSSTFNGGNSWSFAFAARLGATGNRQIFSSLGSLSDFGFFFTSGTVCGFGNGGQGQPLTLPTSVIGQMTRGWGTIFYPGSGNPTTTLSINGFTGTSSAFAVGNRLPGTGGAIIGSYRTPGTSQFSGQIYEVMFTNAIITPDQGAATMAYFDQMFRS